MEPVSFAAAVPKIDLHCHLTGSIPARVVLRSAAKHGVPSHTEDPALFYGGTGRKSTVRAWQTVFQALRDEDDFYAAAYSSTADGARHGNLRYRELMVNFLAFSQHGVPIDAVLDGVVAGLADARREYGVRTRIIALFDRWNDPDDVDTCLRALIERECPEIVGIGIAGWEADNPPRAFARAYRTARDNGLHRTAHSGERGPAQWVAEAVDVLACERIDHGYYTLLDSEITARMRDLRIPFTACWTTTNRQGWDTAKPPHIIRRMMDAGLQVSLHSDDPATFGTTLEDEHVGATRALELDGDELRTLTMNAIEAAWATTEEKQSLRREVDAVVENSSGGSEKARVTTEKG